MIVTINGIASAPKDPGNRIVVHGGTGNDTIGATDRIAVPVWLYADQGNDILFGGGGPSFLFGGSGNSTLWGGQGRAILIAGTGNDTLVTGPGDALLIGGTTAFDTNEEAMFALMSEWNLPPITPHAGCNSHRLRRRIERRVLLGPGTVFDNGLRDCLVGGVGNSLSFQGSLDTIRGQKATDQVLSIGTVQTPTVASVTPAWRRCRWRCRHRSRFRRDGRLQRNDEHFSPSRRIPSHPTPAAA